MKCWLIITAHRQQGETSARSETHREPDRCGDDQVHHDGILVRLACFPIISGSALHTLRMVEHSWSQQSAPQGPGDRLPIGAVTARARHLSVTRWHLYLHRGWYWLLHRSLS